MAKEAEKQFGHEQTGMEYPHEKQTEVDAPSQAQINLESGKPRRLSKRKSQVR
jgi:hypothetical protein